MQCEKMRFMISQHIDRTLPEEDIESLMRHLDACEHCKSIYSDFKNIKSVLSGYKMRASGNFDKEVLDRIKVYDLNKTDKAGYLLFFKRHLVAAACFVFIIASSFLFMMTSSVNNKNDVFDLDSEFAYYDAIGDFYEDEMISFLEI